MDTKHILIIKIFNDIMFGPGMLCQHTAISDATEE